MITGLLPIEGREADENGGVVIKVKELVKDWFGEVTVKRRESYHDV